MQVARLAVPAGLCAAARAAGTQFTCFTITSKKVRKLTQKALQTVMTPFLLQQLERNLAPKSRDIRFGYTCRIARLAGAILALNPSAGVV
jgi:hypothetical protein